MKTRKYYRENPTTPMPNPPLRYPNGCTPAATARDLRAWKQAKRLARLLVPETDNDERNEGNNP